MEEEGKNALEMAQETQKAFAKGPEAQSWQPLDCQYYIFIFR